VAKFWGVLQSSGNVVRVTQALPLPEDVALTLATMWSMLLTKEL
jgi:hypothetical protein